MPNTEEALTPTRSGTRTLGVHDEAQRPLRHVLFSHSISGLLKCHRDEKQQRCHCEALMHLRREQHK